MQSQSPCKGKAGVRKEQRPNFDGVEDTEKGPGAKLEKANQ